MLTFEERMKKKLDALKTHENLKKQARSLHISIATLQSILERSDADQCIRIIKQIRKAKGKMKLSRIDVPTLRMILACPDAKQRLRLLRVPPKKRKAKRKPPKWQKPSIYYKPELTLEKLTIIIDLLSTAHKNCDNPRVSPYRLLLLQMRAAAQALRARFRSPLPPVEPSRASASERPQK